MSLHSCTVTVKLAEVLLQHTKNGHENQNVCINLFLRKIIGLVSHLMNAYCFLQFFDGLVVSLTVFLVRTTHIFAFCYGKYAKQIRNEVFNNPEVSSFIHN